VPWPADDPRSQHPRWAKLDQEGHLRASADHIYEYALPMGIEPYRDFPNAVVVRLETTMARLVQFYATRGYRVVQGREGYTVNHTAETLADATHPDRHRDSTLFLVAGEGRMKELRFLLRPRR